MLIHVDVGFLFFWLFSFFLKVIFCQFFSCFRILCGTCRLQSPGIIIGKREKNNVGGWIVMKAAVVSAAVLVVVLHMF